MFQPYMHDTSSLQPWEKVPAAAGTYKIGQALNMASGKLAPISGKETKVPPYICMANITVTDGKPVPVVKVNDSMIWETTLSALSTGAKPGAMLQISAGGLEVDSAATGSFFCVSAEGTGAGSRVTGRFTVVPGAGA